MRGRALQPFSVQGAGLGAVRTARLMGPTGNRRSRSSSDNGRQYRVGLVFSTASYALYPYCPCCAQELLVVTVTIIYQVAHGSTCMSMSSVSATGCANIASLCYCPLRLRHQPDAAHQPLAIIRLHSFSAVGDGEVLGSLKVYCWILTLL